MLSVNTVTVVAILVFGHGTICTAQSCTSFGNTDQIRRSDSSAKGLFLDLQNPAQCSGIVTAWHYCFYRLESSSDINYIVDFVVYRRRQGSNDYDIVESSYRTVDMSGNQLRALNNFNCRTVQLPASDMFEIQEDDVLGACINDEGNDQKMLDILAESVTNTLYVTDGCTESRASIASRIRRNSLTTSSSFALHLFVDVTQPPPSPSPSSEAVLPRLTSSPATLVAATTARSALSSPPQDSTVSSDIQPLPAVSTSMIIPAAATTSTTRNLPLPAVSSSMLIPPAATTSTTRSLPRPAVSSSMLIPPAATTSTTRSLPRPAVSRSSMLIPPAATTSTTRNLPLPAVSSSMLIPPAATTSTTRSLPRSAVSSSMLIPPAATTSTTRSLPRPAVSSSMLIPPAATTNTTRNLPLPAVSSSMLIPPAATTSTTRSLPRPAVSSSMLIPPAATTSTTRSLPLPAVSSSPVAATTSRGVLIGTSQDAMVSSSTLPFPRMSSALQIPVAATTTRNEQIDSPRDSVVNSNVQSFAAEIPASSASLSSATEQPQLSSAGLTNGIVATIVILVLALAVSATVVVGLVVCFVRQRRYHQFKANGGTRLSGLDNVLYSVANDAHVQLKAHIQLNVPEDQTYEVIYSGHLNTDQQGQYEFGSYSKPVNEFDAPVYYSTIGYGDYFELLERTKEKDIYAEQSLYSAPATQQDELYAQIKSYGIRNIPREEVETVSHLGSGHFGNVDKGLWRSSKNKAVEVALKSLTKGASDEDEVKFLQEAVIMAQFDHPNVISLYGVVSTGTPIMLVVELVHKGDLKECLTFLRPNSGDPGMPQQLLKYSQQVSLGMHYLSSKGFVHRDLAARNILVSQNNICKVADFGMSRDLADETYYVSHGGMIPVKWTAPEAINYRKYSTASDVWSYGCLLYEIWSLGHKPFEGIRNQEVIQKVNSGCRLPPPPGCPRLIYELMIMNWHPDSSLRPGFRDLLLALLQNVEVVLAIPEDAQTAHAQASLLGAPLEAGEQMYRDLQQTYMGQ